MLVHVVHALLFLKIREVYLLHGILYLGSIISNQRLGRKMVTRDVFFYAAENFILKYNSSMLFSRSKGGISRFATPPVPYSHFCFFHKFSGTRCRCSSMSGTGKQSSLFEVHSRIRFPFFGKKRNKVVQGIFSSCISISVLFLVAIFLCGQRLCSGKQGLHLIRVSCKPFQVFTDGDFLIALV